MMVIAAAAELGRLSVEDALAVFLVLRGSDPVRFELGGGALAQPRRPDRWGPRRDRSAADAGRARTLRGPAALPAGRLLAELCALYGLAGAAEVHDSECQLPRGPLGGTCWNAGPAQRGGNGRVRDLHCRYRAGRRSYRSTPLTVTHGSSSSAVIEVGDVRGTRCSPGRHGTVRSTRVAAGCRRSRARVY